LDPAVRFRNCRAVPPSAPWVCRTGGAFIPLSTGGMAMRAGLSFHRAVLCAVFGLVSWALAAQGARVPTVSLTEGPFYKAGSPERADLAPTGTPGRLVTISGTVYDQSSRPVPGAWLDFWQADGAGSYDASGFRFRGHLFAHSSGRYRLSTVIPGEYPGRTPHIHVKLRAPGGNVLTTQIFFPGNARNDTDPVFDRSLVVTMSPDGASGRIDFVIPARRL